VKEATAVRFTARLSIHNAMPSRDGAPEGKTLVCPARWVFPPLALLPVNRDANPSATRCGNANALRSCLSSARTLRLFCSDQYMNRRFVIFLT
jgi:hypothetical protein